MIKVENIAVFNIGRAVYSARNAMDSWSKSDSVIELDLIGEKDLDLAQRLYKGGTEHRKFLRQIFVTMDIVAPRYFYTEFDTYKVGTASNSCSTMHTIHKRPFTLDDFSHEYLENPYMEEVVENLINELNRFRNFYLETQDKKYWYAIIQLLPQSYNQRRTVTMNYENVMNMINQRENHKLKEWRDFVKILRKLPEVEAIRGEEE